MRRPARPDLPALRSRGLSREEVLPVVWRAVGGSQPHATLDLPRRTRVAGATQVAGATFTAGVRTGILGTVLLGLLAVSAGIARLALLGWLLGRVLA
jgi:hypothetical protein